jgi:hypothetical protein
LSGRIRLTKKNDEEITIGWKYRCQQKPSVPTAVLLFSPATNSVRVVEIVSQRLLVLHTAQIAEYKSNIQIIGIVEIVVGILALIGGFLAAIAGIILPTLIVTDGSVTHGPEANTTAEFPAAAFIGILAFMLAILLLIYAIGAIVSGRRLLQYENSGRIGTMIIGAISLISFPLGTIFGIAALYILSKPEVEQLFNPSHSIAPVLS